MKSRILATLSICSLIFTTSCENGNHGNNNDNPFPDIEVPSDNEDSDNEDNNNDKDEEDAVDDNNEEGNTNEEENPGENEGNNPNTDESGDEESGEVDNKPNEDDETNSITIWAPLEHVNLYKSLVNNFKIEYEEYAEVEFLFEGCYEADAYGKVSQDVTNAADVYTFSNDQLFNLIRVGALSKLDEDKEAIVMDNNIEITVESSMDNTDGEVYAYPMTYDIGYMLTYNKEVIPNYNEEMTFFEVAEACAKAGKQFVVPMGDARYAYGFFAGFGGKYSVNYDEEGNEKSIACNYNGEPGIKTGTFLIDLANTQGFQYVDGGNSGDVSLVLNHYLATHMDEIGAFISYPSAVDNYVFDNLPRLSNRTKENVACDVLPMMVARDGTKERMRSFLGMKMVGVNPTSDNLTCAHDFAAYITSEEVQLARYEAFDYYYPSNKYANLECAKKDIVLSGFNKQMDAAGDPQINVPINFWAATQRFGTRIGFNREINYSNLQSSLDDLVEQITQSWW